MTMPKELEPPRVYDSLVAELGRDPITGESVLAASLPTPSEVMVLRRRRRSRKVHPHPANK